MENKTIEKIALLLLDCVSICHPGTQVRLSSSTYRIEFFFSPVSKRTYQWLCMAWKRNFSGMLEDISYEKNQVHFTIRTKLSLDEVVRSCIAYFTARLIANPSQKDVYNLVIDILKQHCSDDFVLQDRSSLLGSQIELFPS